MLNLKYLLLLTLISFSLQDSNCLINFEVCSEEDEAPITEGSIDNCLYYDSDGTCDDCKAGYAKSEE